MRVSIDRIRFYGNKADGYSVYRGSASCTVRKTSNGWVATFAGNPSKRNPWVTRPDGSRSRSCMCPTVTVEGTFPTRMAAAEAGCNAYAADYR